MPPSRGYSTLPFRCIHDLNIPLRARNAATPFQSTATFSTSSAANAQSPLTPRKSASQGGAPRKGGTGLVLKKNVREKTGKPPLPGERKALRKRVVLSNTNALEVKGLIDVGADSIADTAIQGRVVGLPEELVDRLRAVEAFKNTQGWNLFRRPACLWREETVELANFINDVSSKKLQGDEAVARILLAGERGAGKSLLLLQTLGMAFLKDWVVINLPNAADITIGHTEYAPVPESNPTVFYQHMYTANLVSQIAKANAEQLSKLKLTQKHDLPIPVPDGITLEQFCALANRQPEISWPVFDALLTELLQPGRPPLMFAIDEVAHIMGPSKYLDRDAKPIHAHRLTIIKAFVDLLSGSRKLPNGGIIMAADSPSNRPKAATLDHCIVRNEAQQKAAQNLISKDAVPQWNPYLPSDPSVLRAMEGVKVQKLGGLNREEARGIMEYYAASGMLRATVSEHLVNERWTLSGGGIVGELEKGTVKYRGA